MPENFIGKTCYYDELEIIGTVQGIQNWRPTPRSKEIVIAARFAPWWNQLRNQVLPNWFVVPLDELEVIEGKDLRKPLEGDRT
jgi:hypothetical protein